MHDRGVDQQYVVERWPKPHAAPSPPRRALSRAEVALALVTAAAIASFTRVFDSFGFVVPVAATALVAHAVCAFFRHRRWRLSRALPISVLCMALTSAAGALRPSIRTDLADAWFTVNNARPPVSPTHAFVLGASLLTGVVVIAADALAFRRRALFGALLPSLLLFGLTAMYGDHRHRLASIVLLLSFGVCFALAHRLAFFDRGSGWMVDRPLPSGRFVMSGLAVSSCAVLVALAVGPSLPGASTVPLVAWRDIGSGWAQQDDGVTLAPLVSVRAQLLTQSDTEVFTVQAAQPDYWRLSALDSFDGTEWTAATSSAVAVTLPTAAVADAQQQLITIKALRGNWVPAAFAPVALQLGTKGLGANGVVFDQGSASLVSADHLAKGDSYVVWSSATATDVSPPNSDELSLPRAVRQRLSSLANQIVRNAGAATAADKATALEAYFLDNFTYDLNVAAGSSITDITSFLERRSGYCEQFAATFAAMARVLGIPSRVAIGYRVGTYDAAANVYSVTGNDAHAWPEVYISGTGWVRYEPTPPSNGTPAAGASSTDGAAPEAASLGASAPGAPDAPTTTAPVESTPGATADPSAVGHTPPPDHGVVLRRVGLIVALLAFALSLPVIIDGGRRARGRRRAGNDARAQIAWLWRDALRWLRIAGVDARATETPLEVAARAAPFVPGAADVLVALAQCVTAACYAAAMPTTVDIQVARAEVDAVVRGVKERVGHTWRLRAYVAQVVGLAVRARATGSAVAPPQPGMWGSSGPAREIPAPIGRGP